MDPAPSMDLHDAASAGDVARVRALLDAGGDVDALDRCENTPLLLACFAEEHHPLVVALLRERGADPHRKNVHWETPRTKAHERFLLSGVDPLADLPAPTPRKTDADELTEPELAVVVDAVRVVVAHDEAALRRLQRDPDDDLYWETRDYGHWDEVELVLPPGDPRTWAMHVLRFDDAAAEVAVRMWTRQEGRSDLDLLLEVTARAEGPPDVVVDSLHVP